MMGTDDCSLCQKGEIHLWTEDNPGVCIPLKLRRGRERLMCDLNGTLALGWMLAQQGLD